MPRRPPTQARRTIIYSRVSTREQAERRLSTRMQAKRCRDFAATRGWDVVAVVTDPGHTGKDLRRPGIEALREHVRDRDFDLLLCYRLDRLARSLRHLLQFVDDELAPAGIDFASCTEEFSTTGAAGRLYLELFGMLAEFERSLIAERTADVLRSKRERGEFCGGVAPYGHRIVAKNPLRLEHNLHEWPHVHSMVRLRRRGQSYQSIADHLNAEHAKPRHAKRWGRSSIRKILSREMRPGRPRR